MKFSRVVDYVLPEKAPSNVFLYHGTSSHFIEEFSGAGLRRPTGNLEDYMLKFAWERVQALGATGYLGVPDEIVKEIREYIRVLRMKDQSLDSCIYMTPHHNTACNYAYFHQKHGYESGGAVVSAVSRWAQRNGFLDPDTTPSDLYPEGKSLVVGALVDIASTSIAEKMDAWERDYEDFKTYSDRDKIPFQQFAFTGYGRFAHVVQGEVRVYKDIPGSDLFWGIPTSGASFDGWDYAKLMVGY